MLLGLVLLPDPRKWSREPKKAQKEKELEPRLLSLPSACALPREQSRFGFCRTDVRLRLFLTSSMVMPALLGTDQQ